jgi:hypothetical protein
VGQERDGSGRKSAPGRWLTRRRVGHVVVFVGGVLMVVAALGPKDYRLVVGIDPPQAALFAFLLLGGALICAVGVALLWGTAPASDLREIETIREERSRLEEKIAGEARPDVLDTAQLSLNDLKRYHTINQAQARHSFNVGVAAFLIGFTAILAGIVFYYTRPSGGVQIAAVSTIGGAIGSFISGSCFLLYRRAMMQADYFYSNLVQAQDTMIAVRLCDEIEDPQARTEAIGSLIKTLGRRPRPAAGLLSTTNGFRPARRRAPGRRSSQHVAPADRELKSWPDSAEP